MFRRLSKYILMAAVGVALGMALTPPSEATTWTYTEQGGFDFNSATTGGVLTGTACCGTIDFFNNVTNLSGKAQYQTIAWGCPSDDKAGSTSLAGCTGGAAGSPTSVPNKNTITVADPADPSSPFSALQLNTFTGNISDDGVWVDISQLVHFNRVIDADSRTLGTVGITAQIDLAPEPGPPFPNANTIDISFLESLNTESCTETKNPLGSHCDDLFTVLTLGGFNSLPFTFDGQKFVMEFRLQPPCNNVTGTAPGETSGTILIFECSGDTFGINFSTLEIYAPEGQDSSIFVQARILPVPGPATAILIGLGLAGMGLVPQIRRRVAGR